MEVVKRIFFLGAVVFSSVSCILLMDEPEFVCSSDSDCLDGKKCMQDDSFTDGICRSEDWCDEDSHCSSSEFCVSGECKDVGGEGGACRDDVDCQDRDLKCVAGQCVEAGGTDGYCVVDEDCAPGYDCVDYQCTCVETEEVCNGIDDDCDGTTDEDIASTYETCGVGECERTIEQTCVNGVFVPECSPDAPSSTDLCDGLDNNCDGQTDEDTGTLSCGVGECANTVEACVSGVEQTCAPQAPSADVCDGLDNDCDGLTDNDLEYWLDIQGDVITDNCNGIMWQRDKSAETGHLENARKYCADLIHGPQSETDWRVPSTGDYDSILGNDNCASSDACSAMFTGDTSVYWAEPGSTIDFGTGQQNQPGTAAPGYSFRCVRSTDAYGELSGFCAEPDTGDWVVTSGGIVEDNCRGDGLMWQGDATTEEYNLGNSKNYCEVLNLGGYSDWRLPSVDDYITIFKGCTQSGTWSESWYCDPCSYAVRCNALFGGGSSREWTYDGYVVEFHTGEMSDGWSDFQLFQVRCVRDK